jgi:peptidoglycan/xylan/chitin deacetylase (PgdA/CDA1 family)
MCDEGRFWPAVFMGIRVLERRLDYLNRCGANVLPLDEAVELLAAGDLPPLATVLTFDDGWYSTLKLGMPLLLARSLPATIFLTTYHSIVASTPKFRVAVQYMFWRTCVRLLPLDGLGITQGGVVDLSDRAARQRALWDIIEHAELNLTESEQQRLVAELGQRLRIDYEKIVEERFLSLMNSAEIRQAARKGIDFQLHTHRHRFPREKIAALCEIEENRRALESLIGNQTRHFSYPSGEYHPDHLQWLGELGIRSAVTCVHGLNDVHTPMLELRRFVDGDHRSQIEFEAYISGFDEIVRRFYRLCRHKLRRGWSCAISL